MEDLNSDPIPSKKSMSKSGTLIKSALQVSTGTSSGEGSFTSSSSTKNKLSNTWAEVRWVVKVTIKRPGVLNSSERMVAPIQFLSPPQAFLLETLSKRQVLIQQLNQKPFADDTSLVEPFKTFSKSLLYLNGKDLEGTAEEPAKPILVETNSGFFSSFFGKKRGKVPPPIVENFEHWTFGLPTPAVFPMRTGPIPLLLRLESSSSSSLPSSLPIIKLFEHILLEGKGGVKAERSREISAAKLFPLDVSRSPYLRESGVKREYRGFLEVPLKCCSSLATETIKVNYSIKIWRSLDRPVILSQPITLLFPAPRILRKDASNPSGPRIPVPKVSYPPQSHRSFQNSTRLATPQQSQSQIRSHTQLQPSLPKAPIRSQTQPIFQQHSSQLNSRNQPGQPSRSSQASQPSPFPSQTRIVAPPHPEAGTETQTQKLSNSSTSRILQQEAPPLPPKSQTHLMLDHRATRIPPSAATSASSSQPPTLHSKAELLSRDIQENRPPDALGSNTQIPVDTKARQDPEALSRIGDSNAGAVGTSGSLSICPVDGLNPGGGTEENEVEGLEDDFGDLPSFFPPSYFEAMEEDREP